jgi:hypothetical protein
MIGNRRRRFSSVSLLLLGIFAVLAVTAAPISAAFAVSGHWAIGATYIYDGATQMSPSAHGSSTVMPLALASHSGSAAAVGAELTPQAATGFAAEAGGTSDTVVLGHYPEYTQMGEKLGARTFSVPKGVWDAMSSEDQWAANQAFLDEAIANGSEIRLATPAAAAREGSFYERELQYLQSQGYTVSSDGTHMVPGG